MLDFYKKESRKILDSTSTPQHSCSKPDATGKRPALCPHLVRMALAKKQDVALDPPNLTLLGADTVVAHAQRVAHPIQPGGVRPFHGLIKAPFGIPFRLR